MPNPERITGGTVCLGPLGVPAFDPAAFAEQYLRDVPLPVPDPTIPPGRMIVAFPATVVTTTPVTFDTTAPSPFGPLRIRARADIVVDWGDGEQTGPYDHPGEPYPNGHIVHRYASAGRYDVTVTYRWTTTWTWGAQSGAIPGTIDTTTTIPRFTVVELQARTN
ncbi:MAG: hypothetical protein HYX34_05745 [Actinobacteria bacterium]|nr:hypothetical protein [Actinomycetota bacterium]